MANHCYYEMHICGRKDDCFKWLKLMEDYNMCHHFYRIFSAEVFYEEGDDKEYTLQISGDCAWSLESCCRASGYAGEDLFERHTANLHLKMEAYSEESGIGFMEHYYYDNGRCVEDECADFTEWLWDKQSYPTYKEFVESLDLDDPSVIPPEDEFDYDGVCRVGGFEWDFAL